MLVFGDLYSEGNIETRANSSATTIPLEVTEEKAIPKPYQDFSRTADPIPNRVFFIGWLLGPISPKA